MRFSRLARTNAAFVATMLVALVLAGCGDRYARAVQSQHASLYGCPEDSVVVRYVAVQTYAASGCGRRITYACPRGVTCAPQGEIISTAEAAETHQSNDVAGQHADLSAPDAPEIGGTVPEARAVCQRQGGASSEMAGADGSSVLLCHVDTGLIFSAHVDTSTSAIDEVDAYLAGASLPTVRDGFEATWGGGEVSVDASGFRVWSWPRPEGRWSVRMYDAGVRITVRSHDALPKGLARRLSRYDGEPGSPGLGGR